MDEDRKPTHQYPGWGLDLRWRPSCFSAHRQYPMGVDQSCSGSYSAMLCVREVAMMLVMDRLTDKPDWHVEVFDDTIAAKWCDEAMAWPDDDLWSRIRHFDDRGLPGFTEDDLAEYRARLPRCPKNILNEEAVNFCILELRHKAEYFKRTGIIPTLDATFTVVKSDVLVPRDLHEALREAFVRLQADQSSHPDWHPNTNGMVQDLVHPSMYPLVYGWSRFFEDEVVGIDDAVDKWAGKGQVIPRLLESDDLDHQRGGTAYLFGGPGIDDSFWSTKFQWLPANIDVTPGGGVRFTSYINNLHPNKYRDIYGTIEKLVEASLPLWDQCLVEDEGFGDSDLPGRHKPRLRPANEDDENEDNWDPPSPEAMLLLEKEATRTGKSQDNGKPPDEEDLRERWMSTREPIQIQPPAFNGDTEVDYNVHHPLANMHKDSGLQVIVRLASIELSPEKPEFPPGEWHVEGQMNESIVATALYYLDSENITESHLEFRAQTDVADSVDNWIVSEEGYHWMESIYGVELGDNKSPCLQHYGSVVTREGRLLAFPNVLHDRFSGFKLADPSKPGHCRFIALWLVNPLRRIINTGNVPPQQADWWKESAFGSSGSSGSTGGAGTSSRTTMRPEIAALLLEKGLGKGYLDGPLAKGKLGSMRLPDEVLDMIREDLGDFWPMTRERAELYRRELMEARTVCRHKMNKGWHEAEYSFCEN